MPEQPWQLIGNIAEAIGSYPEEVCVTHTILIQQGPKRRVIGLLNSLVRLLTRARRKHYQQWDRNLQRTTKGFVNHAGQRLGDSVWRAQVRGVLAKEKGRKVVEHTEDITACYDHVQFKVLQHGGVVTQFPLALLRLSISV